MKTRTKVGLWFGLVIAIIAAIIGVICIRTQNKVAFAEGSAEAEETEDGFIVSSYEEDVAATYDFVRLNDTECSVRINNKSEATKAIVPSVGKIDGKDYKVTEVATNGFMSSSKLVRVNLPYTIKKIGNNAFINCAKLNRINLSNVEEIGNNVFMSCPSLTYLVIPKSVTKIGTYILRNNNTQVRVRAEEAGANWASSWNSNNTNQEVEYSSTYIQPLELEPIYNSLSRSADEIIGYALAGGQPRTDEFYTITDENWENSTEPENGSIFIPAYIKDGSEYVPIKKISANAFSGVLFDQLIVEYSEDELIIEDFAFFTAQGENIFINRRTAFQGESIFMCSLVGSIILPDCEEFTTIVPSMFAGCENLSNLFIIEPENFDSRSDALEKISELIETDEDGNNISIVKLPGDSHVTSIEANAFDGTTSIKKLHLDENLMVGSLIIANWTKGQVVFVNNTQPLSDNWAENWDGGCNATIEYAYTAYTIKFVPNTGKFIDGDESPKTQSVVSNQPIGDLPIVSKDHYNFDGWYYGDTLFTSSTVYELNQDITLTAKWVCTIKIDNQDGEGKTSIDFYYGDPLPDFDAPTKTGFDFLGYFGSPDNKDVAYYHYDMDPANEEKFKENPPETIYAHWNGIKYDVTFYPQNGDKIFMKSIEFGGNMPDIDIPVKDYYDFMGYYAETAEGRVYFYSQYPENKTSWCIVADTELYALWKPHKYKINYVIEDMRKLPENYGNEEHNPINYTIDTKFPLQITGFDSYGYQITWNQTIIKDFSEKITVYGVATRIDYSIVYELNGGTNNSKNQETYNVENTVLYAPTHPDHDFTGWELDGEKITNLNGITGNITLTATWSDVYNIYISKGFTELLVDKPKVKIVLNTPRVSYPCTINVSAMTDSLSIDGSGLTYAMNINIMQRYTDFDLSLHQIGIQAHSEQPAISMSSSKILRLSTTGTVIIKGCSKAVFGEDRIFIRRDGVAAISCGTLYIRSADYLFIQGGSGEDGRTFTDGNGGDGGNAAPGVLVNSQLVVWCYHVYIFAGFAGDGGNAVTPSTNFGVGGNSALAAETKAGKAAKIILSPSVNYIYTKWSFSGQDGGIVDTFPSNTVERPIAPEEAPPASTTPTTPTTPKPMPDGWQIYIPVNGVGDHLPTPPRVPSDRK